MGSKALNFEDENTYDTQFPQNHSLKILFRKLKVI